MKMASCIYGLESLLEFVFTCKIIKKYLQYQNNILEEIKVYNLRD